MTADTKTGWNFNRYNYAANNPYKFTDPDGRIIKIVGDDKFNKSVNDAIKKIESGKGGAALVSKLRDTKNVITIKQSTTSNSALKSTEKSANGGKGTGSTISFNPSSTSGGKDEKGSNTRPAFVGLAHEMGHSRALDIGKQSYDFGDGAAGTTPPAEVHSLANENMVRGEHGLPLRPSYYEK